MNTVETFAWANRVVFLSHAIRHLVDHTDPVWSANYSGDTEAIRLLQYAMDGPEPRCEYPSPESSYGACDSLPCGKPADDSGFCAKHKGEMGI